MFQRSIALFAPFLLFLSVTSAQSARLDASAFQKDMGREGAQLVDVRTPEEFSKGHIEGAVNIDWLADGFMNEALKLDKTKQVLLYCAGGGRSEEALNAMTKAGYAQAHDLLGGYNGWKKLGLPSTTK